MDWEFFHFDSYWQNVGTKNSQTKWKVRRLAYWYHVSVSRSTRYHACMHASVSFSYPIVGIRLRLLHYPRTWYVQVVDRSLGGICQIWVSTSLYQELGNLSSIKMFDAVFGFMVRTETPRSWLWMENIYKWISILAKSTTPEGIMKIVPLRKQYLFVMHTSKTRRQDLIKSKHLKKYLLIVQQLERSGSQKQLVFQNTNITSKEKQLCITHWIR